MEMWLDTIDITLIKKAKELGILHGVTTNPSILSKAATSNESIMQELLEVQKGPVTIQVVADTAKEMVQQGNYWHAFSPRLIIKVPVTLHGLQAIHALSKQNIPTMATVVFHPRQCLLAALAGADYIAPYYGRIEDSGQNAAHYLKTMCRQMKENQFQTKLLVASLRTLEHISLCADIATAAITVKDALFLQFIEDHPLTVDCVETFKKEWVLSARMQESAIRS
jgi:transaldolase